MSDASNRNLMLLFPGRICILPIAPIAKMFFFKKIYINIHFFRYQILMLREIHLPISEIDVQQHHTRPPLPSIPHHRHRVLVDAIWRKIYHGDTDMRL